MYKRRHWRHYLKLVFTSFCNSNAALIFYTKTPWTLQLLGVNLGLSSVTCQSQLPCGPLEHLTVTVFPRPPAKLRARLKAWLSKNHSYSKLCIAGVFFPNLFAFSTFCWAFFFTIIYLFLGLACSFNEGLVGTADASIKWVKRDGRCTVQVKNFCCFFLEKI